MKARDGGILVSSDGSRVQSSDFQTAVLARISWYVRQTRWLSNARHPNLVALTLAPERSAHGTATTKEAGLTVPISTSHLSVSLGFPDCQPSHRRVRFRSLQSSPEVLRLAFSTLRFQERLHLCSCGLLRSVQVCQAEVPSRWNGQMNDYRLDTSPEAGMKAHRAICGRKHHNDHALQRGALV